MTAAFSGRRMLVTGGARGIGKAAALRFLAAGAQVACLDMDEAALAELEHGFVALKADVTDTASVEKMVAEAAARMGGLDGIVNSAGVDLQSSLEDMTDAAWERLIAVNLTGPMKVCRTAVPFLKAAGGGTIVNVSSGAGLQPLMFRSAYSASKAGLQMFSKSLAMELAAAGIRVNVVCPGAVETPLFRSSIAEGETGRAQLDAVRARYALARIADPDEIAAGIAFLSSAEASYVTGVALAVDGGRTFH
ncbi:SDR family oxidoreductase [Aquamicrobium sp. LC103]|uniref:SDR family NAD(P)-dependent oxidoreductase n=1 Tax=Aquamicrobium sp. LC103 TaxID=1120658 RepID=UPI00063E994F|nr:SDR family oxidoreductase [Aquamicrobium sp. LC103]TKT75832.1 SDR family oxidoreductase [Aquamicrobium sp. LC103]